MGTPPLCLSPQVGGRWLVVVLFAIAMAWVESAVVYDLRTMVDRIEPYQPNPLPIIGGLGRVEMVREAATLIMLLTVGILAGRTCRSRLGYAAVAFGVWDIFYYVFLNRICGWPHSLLDWDILFLLPLPWWGPVLAPMSIALLMILWGTLVGGWQSPVPADGGEWKAWLANFIGVALALYLFMSDSIRVVDGGVEAMRNVLPSAFNWPLFCLAVLLMGAPVIRVLWLVSSQNRPHHRPLDCAKWLIHFSRNRQHRPEPDWSSARVPAGKAGRLLLRSLEQFQLGDGGGPASLIARDAERFRSSTAEMRALVDLWFAEEKEHSRLLGCAVDQLGGKRIASHWSFTAFCQCRRILGVRFELQVLLLTEITSTAYYRLLQHHGAIPALEAMCGLILRDEGGHVAFHNDRLAAAGRKPWGLGGRLWALQFHICGCAAATMLWLNHGPCLVSLGATTREFYSEVRRELRRFLRALAVRSEVPGLLPEQSASASSFRFEQDPRIAGQTGTVHERLL
ncbi:MAG TPA: hypothetical protein VN578_05215 [Candidatus Binatia bacterium]|nr:hypothetical protein [Candidatus Binatia bacterium]